MTAKEIKEMALNCGACELINSSESIADLVSLMCTPQGREFCKKHRFPTIDILRQHKAELAAMNVYVDAGIIELEDTDNLVLAGATSAIVRYKSTDKPYHMMVMHGASAKITAYGYSICQVTDINGRVEYHTSKNASVFIK